MKGLYLLFILGCLLACTPKNTVKTVDFTAHWDTVRVLKNPHKGWYHHLLDNRVDRYGIKDDQIFRSFPGMDHLYLRLAWSFLEPEEGKYDWRRIDEVVEKYVPLGYHLAFRITSKETGTFPASVGQELHGVQYATPTWVAKAGAKGTVAEYNGIKSWVPVWDDPVYLEKLDRFQSAFAARYDGQPWVSYIDIGSIGEWGEGHTSFSTKIPPTVNEIKANIAVFLNHFKKSQLVCNDDLICERKEEADVKTLYEYVVKQGISFRDDSPLVDWYFDHNLDTWTVSNPEFYDPLYLERPVIFELQHYHAIKKDGNWLGKNGTGIIPEYGCSGAEVMRKAIELMHATYIGYHGFAEDWLAENPDLTNELANRCGYWYFPVSASYPQVLKPGQNEAAIVWENKGIAPAYRPFALVWQLDPENADDAFELLPVPSGNKTRLPGARSEEKYTLDIPSGIKKGTYQLKFKLVEQKASIPLPIQIGLEETLID
ncbi:MAG: DUF4832 domain-containing protein, partial [Mangrovibacterium sp.]|nr:DUF4832 domain-containing protein [Mangrovibacterium sp.]